MVFLLILTLCGSPHLVVIGDGHDVHYQYWSNLPMKEKEMALSIEGRAEIELWQDKCA